MENSLEFCEVNSSLEAKLQTHFQMEAECLLPPGHFLGRVDAEEEFSTWHRHSCPCVLPLVRVLCRDRCEQLTAPPLVQKMKL